MYELITDFNNSSNRKLYYFTFSKYHNNLNVIFFNIFVKMNKKALENCFISEKIHYWIKLLW